MKIRTALIIGLLVLNGSGYAMMAGNLPLPKVRASIRISEISVSRYISKNIPTKPAKSNSKLDSLILEYQISRALSSSS